MLLKEMQNIFEKVQKSSASHQKYITMLSNLYKQADREEFLQIFFKLLYLAVRHPIENDIYIKRVLTVTSRFCSDTTQIEGQQSSSHDFLSSVIEKILEWGTLDSFDMRYHCCYFIAMVLQDIGEKVQLEITLIDEIQVVLLERMQETKTSIRLVAMSALVRLQDPHNFECPVIQAYVEALTSGSANIRKEATNRIAPNMVTLVKIRDRVRDIDASVREAAFHKCADIGPLNFRIVDKHIILKCGFNESNEKVKNKFLNYLLPKWLTGYKGDHLKFMGALKLIADEEDVKKMTYLSKQLIRYFYNNNSVEELISVLPINEEKVIDAKKLNTEVSLFWNILVSLLRESDNMDEYLNRILPELTPFCGYIQSIMKQKSPDKMDEWKLFEFQFELFNLLEIAESYDYSDEVGRRTMHALVYEILQENNFNLNLTKKLVIIAQKCSSNLDFFTNEICQLMCEIREPLQEQPPKQDLNRDFKIAELRVKMNIAQENHDVAVKERNYTEAIKYDNDLKEYKKQLQLLQGVTEKVRVAKSDDETVCRVLDIFGSVLELPQIEKLTPSLITCKDQFLLTLISHQSLNVHWRVLKCLVLCALLDKTTAEEYAKVICIPLATYRTIPAHNVNALLQSIGGVTDLICLYGVEIVSPEEEITTENERRPLYDSEREKVNAKIDNMSLSYILDIFLDMLDDEATEIRHKAVLAISSLTTKYPVTANLFSRIMLKWYSPSTDASLRSRLGLLIDCFIQTQNSGEVIKGSVLPTLGSIARAPRTSPLADIDIDNVVSFFAEVMKIHVQQEELRILSLDMCMEMCQNPTDRVVLPLTKLLLHLDVKATSTTSLVEIIERAQEVLENVTDKPKKNLEKFIFKLKQSQMQARNDTNTTISETEAEEKTNSVNKETAMKEPQQIKRRKSRKKSCVVLLERMEINNENNKEPDETILHTIVEDSMEMEIDNNLSNDSSKASSTSTRRNNIVISETTTDSDSEKSVPRRSTRKKKMLKGN